MPTEWSDIDPCQWCLEALPDVELLRPPACPTCLTAAKVEGRVVLQGHGKRQREVVVPAVVDEEDKVELLECWVRRYSCVLCGAVVTVLPKGVLPRYLYSAAAMVMAFLLTAREPVGEGLNDADAYDRQGMNPRRGWTKPWPYRWRSLDRWLGKAATWWPGRAVGSPEALLTGFMVNAGSDARREVLAAAVGTHVRWGCAM